MTAAAMELYGLGLAGEAAWWEANDTDDHGADDHGTDDHGADDHGADAHGPGPLVAGRLPVSQWRQRSIAGDEALLARCCGRTLDVGCGPGRLTVALASRGVSCLGIDLNATAVAVARAAGATALRRDLFGPVPAVGRWCHLILADGNIGIAGDPVRVLARCRELVAPDGTLVVDLADPGTGLRRRRVRLRVAGRTSSWFPWAWLDLAALGPIAAATGWEVAASWRAGERSQAELRATAVWDPSTVPTGGAGQQWAGAGQP